MDVLTTTAAEWGIALTPQQREQFAIYAAELMRWNERVNLTAITDEHAIVARHFLDSLRCGLSWGASPASLIDVGSGAGFPGLVLKIAWPAIRVTLVESIAKKAAFLEHMLVRLGLSDVMVLVARAEVLGHDPAQRERYDVAVARAVAGLPVLAEYCLPLCRIGGRFLAPKGAQIAGELAGAQAAITRLGGRVAAIEPVLIPGIEPRTLVVIDKLAATPPQYPRAPGLPAKRPL